MIQELSNNLPKASVLLSDVLAYLDLTKNQASTEDSFCVPMRLESSKAIRGSKPNSQQLNYGVWISCRANQRQQLMLLFCSTGMLSGSRSSFKEGMSAKSRMGRSL